MAAGARKTSGKSRADCILQCSTMIKRVRDISTSKALENLEKLDKKIEMLNIYREEGEYSGFQDLKLFLSI